MTFWIYAKELNNSWDDLPDNPAETALQMLENNPFGRFDQMESETPYEYVPLNRETVLAVISAPFVSDYITIGLGADVPFPLGGTITRDSTDNGISLSLGGENVEKAASLEEITKYLQGWRFALPAFHSAIATAEDRENAFWMDIAETEPLPDCFGSRLGWYHVISPRGYQDYFRREDLLRAPALRLEELPDGAIALMSYAHPLEFATPENTAQIIKITNYLNSVRLD
jgi:hypothetical protein